MADRIKEPGLPHGAAEAVIQFFGKDGAALPSKKGAVTAEIEYYDAAKNLILRDYANIG